MLDRDLAELYGVETKYLKRQVRRNIQRFPSDFMFELTKEELASLRSQFGTLKRGGHSKYLPMAFTEQGVAQLSMVINSEQAILVNIQIIRLFAKMRKILIENKDVLLRLEQIEKQTSKSSTDIEAIFSALRGLLIPETPERTRIGFRRKDETT